ncbi:NUDIX hydrolase domain-like protein [Hypoxylon sp. NC1633]|nr:NUDIX hydrolase domain-like protein [Hypoxylon sp. NC1633]
MALPKRLASFAVDKSVNLQFLNSSRNEFRQLRLSASGRPYDKVVVGAATLQNVPGPEATPTAANTSPRILLLKRAPHEPYFPNVFELPSGKVDPDDPTLKHALVREVQEETGLDITGILAELNPMIYTTEKTILNDAGQEEVVSKTAIQLNYVVLVSPGEVKVNPEEHSESCWASEAELDQLNITAAMKEIIKEAFHCPAVSQ